MIPQLVQRMLDGDRRALARLLSLLEQDPKSLPPVMKAVHPHIGRAYCIGVTGPPGAGKSTVVDGFVQILRDQGTSVGVLAVDPTSPFTGGAVLGDRIRMQRHSLDEGVFIRSLGTRGTQGGLSRTVGAAVKLLDAYGRDVVIVETVGVGQTELDIVGVADTVVVVLTPESGDAVQAMKAGLTEIADVFAVNKADREGAGRLVAALRSALAMAGADVKWRPPVLKTVAHKGDGVRALYDAVVKHRRTIEAESQLDQRRRERRRRELADALTDAMQDTVTRLLSDSDALKDVEARVAAGEIDPYSAAARVLEDGTLAVIARRPEQGASGSDARGLFLGIDPTSSESKRSACAVLDEDGALVALELLGTDSEILELAARHRPDIVAIDAPLGLPTGMDCLEETCSCASVHEFKGRLCERELLARGISLYITTKRSFIKRMIYRCMGLVPLLETMGCRVIEVYPYASKVCLFGKPIPKKTTSEGREFLRRHLGGLIPGLNAYDGRLDHDLYDALMAAYTAYLHGRGETESLGRPEEVCIVVPRALAGADRS